MKRTELKSKSQLKSNKPLQSKSTLRGSSSLKSKKRINGKSKKQKEIDDAYHEVKKEAFSEEELCTGCEQRYSSTPSHLIPRNRRRDLIAVKRNIKPHCHICHPKWESPERTTLLDYEENMQIVKELDYEYYQMLKRDETFKGC